MASDYEKYDGALLGILQNEGKVAPFLDVILGFLYRRTDFFRVMKTETDKLGFPPGIAHKLLENIFRKYEALALADAKRVEEMKKAREKEAREKEEEQQRASAQMAVEEKPISTSDAAHSSSFDEKDKADTDKSQSPAEEARMDIDGGETVHNSIEQTTPAAQPAAASNPGEDEDEKNEDPEQARQRRALQANPMTYNGADRDAYCWSQTITETDLRVKVPKSVVKGKQVKVDIQKKHIRVSALTDDGSWSNLVDGDLSWEVNTEESMWTLIPGEFVHINLEKKQERWWEHVFVDEPKINTRKIDCSRPMTDLDDEAQAKIEEMLFNQRQKQLGLPQSHEAKTHDMLRKAWDAEGSPFKGQPFDPSRFSVDPGGAITFKDS
ncbi:unnamed protein product [Candidula unifasciata]|uniref:CS domain-containing protein n=1 Tax=Candidula unifasciata TaxID=100452 RepID=A0A8S3ZXT4_9EUPU|nr:unnamed protein product [Candidula unifasciata]